MNFHDDFKKKKKPDTQKGNDYISRMGWENEEMIKFDGLEHSSFSPWWRRHIDSDGDAFNYDRSIL